MRAGVMIGLVTLLVALPGCFSASTQAPLEAATTQDASGANAGQATLTDADGVAATGAGTVVFFINGTFAADAIGLVGPTGGDDPGFPVFAGAKRITATLTWTGAGTDLDAILIGPNWCKGDSDADSASLACAVQSFVTGDDPGQDWFRNSEGTPATPDNPSIVVVEGDALTRANDCGKERCAWAAIAYAKPAANASFSMRVDVEYDA